MREFRLSSILLVLLIASCGARPAPIAPSLLLEQAALQSRPLVRPGGTSQSRSNDTRLDSVLCWALEALPK
jgi:hypothetical protein